MIARILIIEDNRDYAEVVSFYLRSIGYTVDVCHDGRDGLLHARQHHYDLIITDLMLPSHTGYEICSLLKQDVRHQRTPILVLTASRLEPKDQQLAQECGADAFCPKSMEPKRLAEKIQELIEGAPESSPPPRRAGA